MKKLILVLSLIGIIGCAQDDFIEVEGRISVKGSGPHTYIIIKDKKSHESYKIKNHEKFGLMQKQNQTFKVKAMLLKEAIGPGFPAVIDIMEIE